MANYCYTQYTIFGSYDICKKCLNKIQSWILDDSQNDWSLYGISKKANIKLDNYKGEINYISKDVEENDEYSNFMIELQTAWIPRHDIIKLILNKYFPDLEYRYLSEEPYNKIFESNDINQDFYDVEYLISSINDEYNYLNENICGYYTKNELEDLLFKDNITSEIFNDSLDILKKMYKVNIQYIKYISEGNNKIAN